MLSSLTTGRDSNDLLIAAHCLARDVTLVTGSTREFARGEGVGIAHWSA